MDYPEAEKVMEQVLQFVFEYLTDYPDALDQIVPAPERSLEDIETAYQKVKNG